jgi:hypothetical protein
MLPLFAGPPHDAAPSESSGWFELTMHFGHLRERLALLEDPGYIRIAGRPEGVLGSGEPRGSFRWVRLDSVEAHPTVGWARLDSDSVEERYSRLTEGLEPRPISELPHLRATAPELAVAARAAAGEGGDAAVLPWLPLGAGVGLLVSAGLLLARRRVVRNHTMGGSASGE